MLGGLPLLAVARPGLAQDSFPTRPIQMIVPFPPGGVADITGRPTAMVMGKLLKQSVVVVNKSGAGGSVGTAQAARAAPDGYTILMALSSISVLPAADRLQGPRAAYSSTSLHRSPDQRRPHRLLVRGDGPTRR